MSKKKVEVYLPKMIPAALLVEHIGNSQKQTKHEFAELRKSIRENGFDESLLVRPVNDGYEVIAGNHRFRAGVAEGMPEFPCVIRDDWDEIKSEIESVRRNYVRGKINKTAFTEQVDRLASDSGLTLDVIYEQMGFEDGDAFAKYYEKQHERDKAIAEAITTSTSAQAVKILDDLGTILSNILAQYGHTVLNSFIIFPAAGKHHLYISSSPALKQILQAIAEQAVAQGIDINIALSGLLQIGCASTNFLKGDGGVEVNEKGQNDEGSADIEPVGLKDDQF